MIIITMLILLRNPPGCQESGSIESGIWYLFPCGGNNYKFFREIIAGGFQRVYCCMQYLRISFVLIIITVSRGVIHFIFAYRAHVVT